MPTDQPAAPAVRLAAGTIVARNYLPAARVLAGSYLRHHPGAGFAVLVVDADRGDRERLAAQAPELRILVPAELDMPAAQFGRMAMAYSVTELCTAVKPWLLRRLLTEADVAIYLDPDIEVFGGFAGEVAELAVPHQIVLTPHVLEPMPRDGLRPSEADIMASGVFNLGFIGVSAAATGFLDFWAERLRHDAISAVAEQLFTDQRWVDNVPAMFPHTVLDDPGYDVAYWNVYQRELARQPDGTITAGGAPLRFYHYSGYRPEKPWLTSTHYADKPRLLLSEQPLLAELFAGYRGKLIEAGYAEALDDVPYRWNTLPDGTPVSLSLRRAFRQAWVDAERSGTEPPPSPFGGDATAAERFLGWAAEPADIEQERAGLSRWAMAVWRSRADLQAVFGDPLGGDADGFRVWCAGSGVAEGELVAGAVAATRPKPAVPVTDTLGVNVLGYLTAELGVGEMGRLVHDAVQASGLPMATAVEEHTVRNRTAHPLAGTVRLADPRYPVSVLCVNADMTPTTLRLHPDLAGDRYLIGVWSWELAEFPPSMHAAFNLVNEVWTISQFCADAIAAVSPVPVHVFPVPVRDPLGAAGPDAEPDRDAGAGTGAPGDGPTRFLFVFDHNSVFDRKNPTAAVTAFQRAFAGRDDVRLVLKSINGDKHAADRERLRAAAAEDDRIELIEGYLGTDEVRKLFTTADCYLSLHRSEGFGLTVAEAMAHGLPVIATDYSGTAEFLTEQTGWPVPYRLAPVGPGKPPYPGDVQWAEPDLDAAVAALREVAGDPALARRRGAAARAHVLATRGQPAAADWVRDRLTEAYRRWRGDSWTQPSAATEVAAVRTAREALRWRADVSAPSRLPMAPALRRAVLRAIDHYDHHQRTVLSALMDGVESGMSQLAGRVGELESQLTQVAQRTGRMDRLERELEQERGKLAELAADARAELVSLTETAGGAREVADRAAAQVDALDQKVMGLLGERDRRLSNAEIASHDLRRRIEHELPALRTGLLRHHDLLSPEPDQPAALTEAVATDVGVLRLPAGDTVVLPWLRSYGSWENDESRLVEALLPAGGVFVDIGAHVGYFTIRALRRVGTGGLVLAVEPWRPALDLLERNVVANVPAGVAGAALAVLPAAAWDADGPLRLAVSGSGNTGDNRIAGSGLAVAGVRLDGVAALAGRAVDVVKSDAQGRDQRALAGMAGLIEANHPHVVCEFDPAAIEEAGDDPAATLGQYRAWGYQPVPVTTALVDTVVAGGTVELPVIADRDLVDAARAAHDGFLTLWLHPPATPSAASPPA